MQALVAALLDFRLLPAGFDNRQLRERMGLLLGLAPGAFSQGRMNYDLCPCGASRPPSTANSNACGPASRSQPELDPTAKLDSIVKLAPRQGI